MSALQEAPLIFTCDRARLIGILHKPMQAKKHGVVVVVGAPQYRVGSHRQFVLLARELALAGFPVLRFDYRGMGDSEGPFLGFEAVSSDLRAAIDKLFAEVPTLDEVVLWGLCDGASAIAFYAASDRRVSGVVLLNPWVRSERRLARTRVRHYYLQRLAKREFWHRLLAGQVGLKAFLRDVTSSIAAVWYETTNSASGASHAATAADAAPQDDTMLAERVAASLRNFHGRVLFVLSGNDLTAKEFEETVLKTREMRQWLKAHAITIRRIKDANHSFSTRAWREQVHRWTREWLEKQGTE